MDQVIAKLKRLRANPYKKLLSDTTLFSTFNPSVASTVTYSPDHNLDEDAWFEITEFSKADFFLPELSDSLDAKNYDELRREKFGDISCLLGVQGNDVYFQKVTPSSFLKRKIINFGDTAKLEESIDRIIVKTNPDAVFLKNDDVLLFKDLATISSIFKGIDQLYKEATEEEVKAFLDLDFIQTAHSYTYNSVSKPNRKRLAMVSKTMREMPEDQRANLIAYINEYCRNDVPLTENGKCFELSTDNHLKLVLYGIEERFYTTTHSKQKRLANSVEAMG